MHFTIVPIIFSTNADAQFQIVDSNYYTLRNRDKRSSQKLCQKPKSLWMQTNIMFHTAIFSRKFEHIFATKSFVYIFAEAMILLFLTKNIRMMSLHIAHFWCSIICWSVCRMAFLLFVLLMFCCPFYSHENKFIKSFVCKRV